MCLVQPAYLCECSTLIEQTEENLPDLYKSTQHTPIPAALDAALMSMSHATLGR